MATFNAFMDLLPDPVNKISTAGHADGTGSAGPGFAKVKFTSNNQVQASKTISNRGVATSRGGHSWEFSINYNPITRTEFEPVNSFLEQRMGRLYPFYVILPQYSKPQDATFASYTQGTNPAVSAASDAGKSQLLVTVPQASGTPSPGDFFNIADPNDINHVKTYKVTRIETNALYQAGTVQPTVNQRRITFVPPLTREVSSSASLVFYNPKFRVAQKGDTVEHDLDTDNLYQFSVSVEEILP